MQISHPPTIAALVAVASLATGASLAAGVARADDAAAAQAVMERTTGRLLEQLHTNAKVYQEDKQRLYAMLEEVVLPVVNVRLISRLTLGPHWKTAGEDQREKFVRFFPAMLMKTYGDLLLLSRVKILYEPRKPVITGKKYQIVKTRVLTDDGQTPLSMDYSLIDRGEGWQVFDMVGSLRSGFDKEIQETGFEALLERLSKFDS